MDGARAEAVYEMRYRGQAFELPVPGAERARPGRAGRAASPPSTSARYGYRDRTPRSSWSRSASRSSEPGAEVEPRAAQARRAPRRASAASASTAPGTARGSYAASRRRASAPQGPCIFELPEATLVLPPGWSAEVDVHGTIGAEDER